MCGAPAALGRARTFCLPIDLNQIYVRTALNYLPKQGLRDWRRTIYDCSIYLKASETLGASIIPANMVVISLTRANPVLRDHFLKIQAVIDQRGKSGLRRQTNKHEPPLHQPNGTAAAHACTPSRRDIEIVNKIESLTVSAQSLTITPFADRFRQYKTAQPSPSSACHGSRPAE